MDILSKKMTNTTSTNVTSTSSVTCHSKKVNYKIDLIAIFFSMEMNIYTTNIKTTVIWHHDYYGCQGYKKKITKRKN